MPRPKRIVGDAREGIFRRKGSQDELDEFRNEYLKIRNSNRNTNPNFSVEDADDFVPATKTKGRYQDQPGERPMATERINYSGGEQTSASKKQTRIVGDAKTPTVQYNGGEVSGTKRVKTVLPEKKTKFRLNDRLKVIFPSFPCQNRKNRDYQKEVKF